MRIFPPRRGIFPRQGLRALNRKADTFLKSAGELHLSRPGAAAGWLVGTQRATRIRSISYVCRHPWRRTMALGILAVVVAALAVLFLIPGSTPRIDTRRHPHSLAVLEQVPVNDTWQWVLIRSEDVANPVVLFVHGGPGTSQLTLMRKNTQPLEEALQRRQLGSAARGEVLRRRA